MFSLSDITHRRYNPLTGQWILVSPHRAKRPWLGQQEQTQQAELPTYDSECYLCPGNTRAGGLQNPNYSKPYVFINDFSALVSDIDTGNYSNGLLQAKSEKGICKVMCFSPDHSRSLPEMTIEEIHEVIISWKQQYNELSNFDFIHWIQIFENKGSVMGCSNPHPHCQIWAQESIPEIAEKEDSNQLSYYTKNSVQLLQNYIKQELELKERIVYENECFVVLVPYWATWPFETIIVPKKSISNINEMDEPQDVLFADAVKVITTKYDNLFNVSFPYSSGIHQAPVNMGSMKHWTMHMHFYPPLLRSATVKKFMVGYEMLSEAQRDITPEQSADILRKCSNNHYKSHKNK